MTRPMLLVLIVSAPLLAADSPATRKPRSAPARPSAAARPVESPQAKAQRECTAGRAQACFELGELLVKANMQNLGQAIGPYTKACDAGVADACEQLGWAFKYRDEVGKDETKAAAFYQKEVALRQANCDAADFVQCGKLAEHYEYGGSGLKEDRRLAAALYNRGCAAGVLRACTEQGEALIPVHTSTAYAEAVDLFKKACDGGDARGCGYLGHMYRYGWGVPENPTLAAPLLTTGCRKGDVGIQCYYAGLLYSRGQGVERDMAKAVDLWKVGCERKDDDDSCFGLATALEEGDGVPRDAARAKELYSKVCSATWNHNKDEACRRALR